RATRPCNNLYNQVDQVPSSSTTCNVPRSSWINPRIAAGLVSITVSLTTLPGWSRTATEMLSRCTSKPTYLLLLSIEGCLLCVNVCSTTPHLTLLGAPL